MYGKVAQWLKFCAVNHAIMGSNPAETVYNFFTYFYLIVFVVFFAYFPCLLQLYNLFINNHYNARTT